MHGGPHHAPRPSGYHLSLNQDGRTTRRQSQLGHYSAGDDPLLGPLPCTTKKLEPTSEAMAGPVWEHPFSLGGGFYEQEKGGQVCLSFLDKTLIAAQTKNLVHTNVH